jgi:polysaccharide export outer membrane protein
LKRLNPPNILMFTLSTLLLAASLIGCATNPAIQKAIPVSEMPQAQEPAAYVIRPGDQLDIKFFYNPELNESVTVRPDGKISLQLVDEVQASGLQPAELDAMLTEAYSRELKKPMVTVIVRSFKVSEFMWAGKSTSSAKWSCPPA